MADKKKEVKKPYIIPLGNNPNEPTEEYVSVNGKSWQIQKGVEVMLPESAIEVLENKKREEAKAAAIARRKQQAYMEALAKLNSGQVAPY